MKNFLYAAKKKTNSKSAYITCARCIFSLKQHNVINYYLFRKSKNGKKEPATELIKINLHVQRSKKQSEREWRNKHVLISYCENKSADIEFGWFFLYHERNSCLVLHTLWLCFLLRWACKLIFLSSVADSFFSIFTLSKKVIQLS